MSLMKKSTVFTGMAALFSLTATTHLFGNSTDNQPNFANGTAGPIFALDGGDDLFYSGFDAIIAGSVWQDADGDGLQSSDTQQERGLGSVAVELLNPLGNVVGSTFTDDSGFYIFDGQRLGEYQVRFAAPTEANCRFTLKDAEGNNRDTRDSDANEPSGITDWVTVNAKQPMNISMDAGVVCDNTPQIVTEAKDDRATGIVAETLAVDVLANDVVTAPVTALTVDSHTVPGDVEVVNNQIVVQKTREAGTFNINYRINCEDGSSSTATLELTLTPNPALTNLPTANDDSVVGFVGDNLTVNFLANDSNVQDDTLVNIISSDVSGRVSMNSKRKLRIRNTSRPGTYTVTYEVSSPLANDIGLEAHRGVIRVILKENTQANDDNISGEAGTLITTNVLSNDQIPDGVQSIRLVSTGGLPGTANINQTGALNISNTSTSGTYVLTYEVVSNNGTQDQASVTVNIDRPPGRDPHRAPKSCAIPQAFVPIQGGSVIYVIEPAPEEFAPSYRLYGASGNFLGQYDVGYNTSGWITTGGVMRPEFYSSIFKGYYSALTYSISSVVDGIESPRTYCYFNNHTTPIALDTDNNGRIARINGEFQFDFTGDGGKTTVNQWFAPSEGILIDTRFDGDITGKHLFGDQGGVFADGYEKLAQRDHNKNGWVEGAELEHLGLWTDANSNARVDNGELSSLATHGIVSLKTEHSHYLSEVRLQNGQTMLSEDVWFQVVVPSLNNTVVETLELPTNPHRLPMVLSVLALIFSGISGVGLFYRRHTLR